MLRVSFLLFFMLLVTNTGSVEASSSNSGKADISLSIAPSIRVTSVQSGPDFPTGGLEDSICIQSTSKLKSYSISYISTAPATSFIWKGLTLSHQQTHIMSNGIGYNEECGATQANEYSILFPEDTLKKNLVIYIEAL